MSKHPHAENMALYAQDAMETDRPWERWEVKTRMGGWHLFDCHPEWIADREYRRKPRTININGFEVPEPMREAPRIGSIYYAPTITYFNIATGSTTWDGGTVDCCWLARGLCHTTREAAELHARALLSFTEVAPSSR